jgi:aminobenzoyl-glutamate utilization protein B
MKKIIGGWFGGLIGSAALVLAQAPEVAAKRDMIAQMDASRATYESIAMKIWEFAEVGFQETKSTAALQERLKAEGFEIRAGVAGMPTAFVATYGRGSPVIGLLGEFDALPGVAQEAVPERKPIPGQIAGHACGHHLYATASVEAAVAVKNWMRATGQKGTLRVYGTPAEEGGSGKVYMVRDGLFDDCDAVVRWHAGDRNIVAMGGSLANRSVKFRFHGIASHAAAAPERGRSALDAVEAMNQMVNMMREHMPSSMRVHYVITRGGEAPNVVPAFAESYYYVRGPSRDLVHDVSDRIELAAKGAALGTGTTVDWEVIGGVYELLTNETLGRVMQSNLELVGGVTYTDEEKEFARKLGQTLPGGRMAAIELATTVQPFNPNAAGEGNASTDSADVSWTTPTVALNAATWVPGTSAHSWQAVAAGGTGIGMKGMQVAAKTMALTTMDLFTQPDALKKARAEFDAKRGPGFKYSSLIGDRKPPLDYRN